MYHIPHSHKENSVVTSISNIVCKSCEIWLFSLPYRLAQCSKYLFKIGQKLHQQGGNLLTTSDFSLPPYLIDFSGPVLAYRLRLIILVIAKMK